jgi:hypothetical protein
MPQDLPARVIFLRPEAPTKPPEGAACNGCGVCCALAPCPLGMLLSRRRRGRCRALAWNAERALYRCGVVAQPQRWLTGLRWLPPRWARGLARRWIGASLGCDAALTMD